MFLLCPVLFTGCTFFTVGEDASIEYILKAYLFEGESIRDIEIRKIMIYTTETAPSPELARYELVRDAQVTITTESNEKLILEQTDGTFAHSHVVKPGMRYSITAVIAGAGGEPMILSATTRIPDRCNTISLSPSTLPVPPDLRFQDVFNDVLLKKSNTSTPKITIVISGSAHDHHSCDIAMVVDSGVIFQEKEITETIQVPFQGNNHFITTLDMLKYGTFNLIINNITTDYANIYEGQSFFHDLGSNRLPIEGISNVINGRGVFAGFSRDTVSFTVVKTTRR